MKQQVNELYNQVLDFYRSDTNAKRQIAVYLSKKQRITWIAKKFKPMLYVQFSFMDIFKNFFPDYTEALEKYRATSTLEHF